MVTVQAVPVQEPSVVAVATPLALSIRPESAEPQASDARAESTTSGLAHSAEPQVASAVNPAAVEAADATASVENPVAADAATPGTVSASFEVEDEYAHGDFAVPVHVEPGIGGEAMFDGEAHQRLPSVVAGSAQPGVDVGAHSSTELRDFLVGNDLGRFEDALRSLGAVNVEDLHELDEVGTLCPLQPSMRYSHASDTTDALRCAAQGDLADLGLRKLEVKRMQRALSKLGTV